MADWVIWTIVAGALVVAELLTGTFYLLMLAIGAIAGVAAAGLGASIPVQILCASIVGMLATFLLWRSKFGKLTRGDAARDPNVNLDIGQTIDIESWKIKVGGGYSTRAMYRGALWDIELDDGAAPEPGQHIIREVRGNRLIVSK